MFEKIEETICVLALVFFVIFLIGAAVMFILAFDTDGVTAIVGAGLVVMAFIFCMPLYGFGVLIGEVKKIRQSQSPAQQFTDNDIPEL